MQETTVFAGKLLADLLGCVDSLFNPVNQAWPGDMERDQVLWQTRNQWFESGVIPWASPGTDAAERKAFDRAGAALEKAGLARFTARSTAGLTSGGLTKARSICSRLQLDDVLPGLDFMLSLHGTPHEWKEGDSGGWFSESSLAGGQPWADRAEGDCQLLDSEFWAVDALIPLAIAGLIEHDFRPGFALPLYRFTPNGEKLARQRRKAKKAVPKSWLSLAKRSEREYPPAYAHGWDSMQRFLETAKPPRPNMVRHHLSIECSPGAFTIRKRKAKK